MFVLRLSELLKLDLQKTINTINQFKPLEHRMEYVATINGVKYYNDAIATIPEATINCVEALKDVDTIIFGGMDRGIDYNDLMKYHKESGNDVTVVYKNIKQHSEDKFVDCQVLNLNENSRVIGVGENIGLKSTTNISMEMYIMKTDLFIDIVYKSIKSGMHRKVKDYINANIDSLNVGAFEFTGYLACINSIKAYFDANSDF